LTAQATGETVASTDLSRVLAWEGCFNVRDLGGLTTQDGRVVRKGALIRSDLLCRLTDLGRHAPVAHGVRTIVDVRYVDEVAGDWHEYPFRGWAAADAQFDGLRYVNVPFNGGRPPLDDQKLALVDGAVSRSELNRLDLDMNRPGIAAIVGAIADAQPGGVLVHCHGGKDRTGISIALVLSLLGVEDGIIADDYALTHATFEPILAEWLERQTDNPAERMRLARLHIPSREAMLEMLDHLDRVHGSAESYLRAGGVTDDQVGRLHGRLLE
jgi:protein tyrosine/serine phosphatase